MIFWIDTMLAQGTVTPGSNINIVISLGEIPVFLSFGNFSISEAFI